jgi:hypothetical protein
VPATVAAPISLSASTKSLGGLVMSGVFVIMDSG